MGSLIQLRPQFLALHDHERPQVGVPGGQEGEDGDGGDGRSGQRHDDPQVDGEPARAVVRAADGTVLARATGRGVEQYRRVVLDLSGHIGERICVEVVDRTTGGWGHLNVDDVNVPVRRQ
ncbi:hypothetical protein ACQEV4_16585 [Streptomyces shenzhenensis]|uniref:hypothetical protein n=1 Tax=Streptomyces shenzhenensis TaxID=943815 RepID=UPI003D8C6731